jgi:hypothetical protein
MHSKVEKKIATTRYRPSATFHHPVPAAIKPDDLKQEYVRHVGSLTRAIRNDPLFDSSQTTKDKADFKFGSHPAQLRRVRSIDMHNDAKRTISLHRASIADVVFSQEDFQPCSHPLSSTC